MPPREAEPRVAGPLRDGAVHQPERAAHVALALRGDGDLLDEVRVEAVGQGREQQVVGFAGPSLPLEHRGEVVLRPGKCGSRRPACSNAARASAVLPASRSSEPSLLKDPPVRVLPPADSGRVADSPLPT